MKRRRIAQTVLALALQPLFAVSAAHTGHAQQDTTAVQDTTGIRFVTDTSVVQDTIQVQDAHPQDSPEDRGFVIITKDDRASLRIRGSLRVNGIYDLRGLQNQDNFNTFDIPTGADNRADPRFQMSANQTRLGLDILTDTWLGDVFMRLETDFRGEGNTLRLRHAYGTLARFLVGQTWSVFGDVTALPLTVDLDGPPSGVAVRTVQIRYTWDPSDEWRTAISAESPEPQIGDTVSFQEAFQATPDFAARARLHNGFGHLQLAAIFRTINVNQPDGDKQVLPGFGALLSGVIDIGPIDRILFQLVAGSGISRFISSLDGKGLDVVFNPDDERFETVQSFGGYVSYGHDWRSNMFSNFTLGLIRLSEKDFAPGTAFRASGYASANLFWNATPGTRLGTELAIGRREDVNGADGWAQRLSFIFYFDF